MKLPLVPLFLLVFPLSAQTLRGVVDVHTHADPDSMPRSIGALELVRLYRQHGVRAVVLKNHYEPTASLAWVARREIPGIEVFGGIALNRTIGGINPAAVERMVNVSGGYGRVVWMPTFDAENQVRQTGEKRPFVPISRGGRLLPEVLEVLELIARHKLTLATGHSTPAEVLLLVREARKRGISRIIVTHGMLPPVAMTVAQMKEAAQEGGLIEFVYNALVGHTKVFEFQQYAEAIRAVGPEHCILSSDLGQAGNPLHHEGLLAFLGGMRKHNFSASEVDRMARKNPAMVLGLQ